MKDYIFTITSSGDRTNIMSSFPLWNKEMFLENIKKGDNYGRYRYGKIGGYISLLKDMTLEEFDSVFTPDEFTTKEITEIFRKEISLKYGEHAEKAKIKPLSKKELQRGHFYIDFNGDEYLYLGEIEQTIDNSPYARYQSDKKPLEINKGNGFSHCSQYREFSIEARYVEVLKGIKKFQSKSNREPISLEESYEWESGETRWYEKKVIIKVL